MTVNSLHLHSTFLIYSLFCNSLSWVLAACVGPQRSLGVLASGMGAQGCRSMLAARMGAQGSLGVLVAHIHGHVYVDTWSLSGCWQLAGVPRGPWGSWQPPAVPQGAQSPRECTGLPRPCMSTQGYVLVVPCRDAGSPWGSPRSV